MNKPNSANIPLVFELLDGDVRLWIEQDSIHLIAGDLRNNDPAELTGSMAKELAAKLLEMARALP